MANIGLFVVKKNGDYLVHNFDPRITFSAERTIGVYLGGEILDHPNQRFKVKDFYVSLVDCGYSEKGIILQIDNGDYIMANVLILVDEFVAQYGKTYNIWLDINSGYEYLHNDEFYFIAFDIGNHIRQSLVMSDHANINNFNDIAYQYSRRSNNYNYELKNRIVTSKGKYNLRDVEIRF